MVDQARDVDRPSCEGPQVGKIESGTAEALLHKCTKGKGPLGDQIKGEGDLRQTNASEWVGYRGTTRRGRCECGSTI